MSKELGDAVLRDIYDMYYSRSREEFDSLSSAVESRWQENALLSSFHAYFKRVWLNDRFCRWQCYLTPAGFATTNNPVEQFNRAFKRDYTAHRLLKMGELLQQFSACCRQRSIDVRPFLNSPQASKELLTRVKALRSKQLLLEYVVPRMSVEFLLLDSSSDVLHVLYKPPPRAYNSATNTFQEAVQVSAQVGVNTARMEFQNQPSTGWPVDMVVQVCPCASHFKYGNCVHRLFAMQQRARINDNGDEVLVNRRAPKRKRAVIGPAPTAAGRPPLAGPALQRV